MNRGVLIPVNYKFPWIFVSEASESLSRKWRIEMAFNDSVNGGRKDSICYEM